MNKLTFTIGVLLLVLGISAQNVSDYKNLSLSIDERVNDLLGRMTLEEKLIQVSAEVLNKKDMDTLAHFIPRESIQELLGIGLGQLGKPCAAFDLEAKQSAQISNELQNYILKNGRLGIPTIFHEEALHGLWGRGATVYPQAIAMSSTWEPDLIRDIFTQIALETRSRGSHQVNTPMLDVCRDPRWGRIEESYGEDPYLISCFAKAIVEGLQGTKVHIDKNGIDNKHVIATVKHFAGYGVSERATNKGTVNYGERAVRDVILPPFQAAIVDAGALSVMPGYHAIDGVPSHSNHWLLTEVLRGEWNFEGYVVSDYGGVDGIKNDHQVASSLTEAAQKALFSGIDLELASPNCFRLLGESVANNVELLEALDKAVSRVLTMKFKLGLFDHPYADPELAEQYAHTKEQQALALEAAEKSVVLLKNQNNVLPLDKSAVKKIAVIGPNAAVCRYGGYSHRDEDRGISILEGLESKVGNDIEILYAEGCKIHENHGYWLDFRVESVDQDEDAKRIKEAVEVAKQADIVIMALGGTAMTCGEFLGYRHSLDLFGNQNQLYEAVEAVGKPVVVCLINGRPLTINKIDATAESILECWYLGEKTGDAVANILLGDVVPTGKLTVTFPRSVGHLPQYYNALKEHKHGYLAVDNSPLYPFGYGLSYTSFEYSNLELSAYEFTKEGMITARITIKNTGNLDGEEVVQMYIRDLVGSVDRPLKELKGFEKIFLKKGESKEVTFEITEEDLKYHGLDLTYGSEPGEFEVLIGTNSQDVVSAKFELVE